VKNKILLLFLIIVNFSISFAVTVQDSTIDDNDSIMPVFDLKEVVTTATRVPRRVHDITSAVSVINLQEIENSNANYVMDVIGSQPGIYIRKDAVFGRQAIEIRGLGSNCRRIQTLIDGRPEKMSLFGCTVTQTLPISNIEKIEVLRGPESVLYGTDALGGVVNIITKKLISDGFETNALYSYGSFNSQHALIQHGGYQNRVDYYLTFDYKSSDGHRENSQYSGADVSARIGYTFPKIWKAELTGKFFQDEAKDPGEIGNPYLLGDKREYQRYSWDFDLIGMWEQGDVSINFYQNIGDHQFTMPSISDFWHSNDNSYGLNLKSTWKTFESGSLRNTLTGGYEYKYEWAETLDPYNTWARENMPVQFMNLGEFSRKNHDLFAFNELVFKKLVTTQGVRFHYSELYGWKVLPQLGFLYHFSQKATTRLKVGKGFRQAKFSELYLFPAHNEELQPEETWSYELALNYSLNEHLGVFINPFYMDVNHFIQTVKNPTPPPMMVNQNSGNFYIRGIEAGIDLKEIFPHFSMTQFVTYMDIEDPEGTDHINRQGKPELKFNSLIQYQFKQFRLSSEMEYISGLYDSHLFSSSPVQKIDDFFVVHLKASYQLKPYLQIFAGIQNLLDADYEQFPGYPMPGMNINFGMKASLR